MDSFKLECSKGHFKFRALEGAKVSEVCCQETESSNCNHCLNMILLWLPSLWNFEGRES